MPVASVQDGVNAILDRLKAAWDTNTPVIPDMLYTDIPDDLPAGDDPFAHAQLIHTDFPERTLANDVGARRFGREGQLLVAIFTPAGGGLTDGYTFATVCLNAFEGVRSGSDGVKYSNSRIEEVGTRQAWFQTNFITEFEYDEIK